LREGFDGMASFFYLTLDTLAPQNITVLINDGAPYTASRTVTLAIETNDIDTTGYSMKIWGIDGVATESEAEWEAYAPLKAVNLPDGNGPKTVYVSVRDAVWNQAPTVFASIMLNTAIPVVTASSPDVPAISTVPGKDAATFSFVVNEPFIAYSVRVVPEIMSLHTDGVQIPTTNGSTNMSGTGAFAANTEIVSTINGADLYLASNENGEKIIGVYAQNTYGLWSVGWGEAE